MTEDKEAVMLHLVRRKKGNWNEAQALFGAEVMTEFEEAGYIQRDNDDWLITTSGKMKGLDIVFHAPLF